MARAGFCIPSPVLTEYAPGARQVLFEQRGHFAHLEAPEAFAKAVLDFVSSTRSDYRPKSQR